ncbi:hypothetical protein OsI_14403 [Oryza sativa Indica Group]|uniref:Uncharacterized protein n=1 Tax=Oryza sativa subsp. indica TaxID=39946 RepID=B8ANS0_ORYSI|nr:hypothetical protein OsI_14403 [Oryza sativa Indica Group]
MFSHGADSAHDAGAVSTGASGVPTRFVWPYGGKRGLPHRAPLPAGVSSIPIVDDNDSLLDTYSRSDITALAKDKVYTHIRLDEMTIHQALQLGQDANSPFGFF